MTVSELILQLQHCEEQLPVVAFLYDIYSDNENSHPINGVRIRQSGHVGFEKYVSIDVVTSE